MDDYAVAVRRIATAIKVSSAYKQGQNAIVLLQDRLRRFIESGPDCGFFCSGFPQRSHTQALRNLLFSKPAMAGLISISS